MLTLPPTPTTKQPHKRILKKNIVINTNNDTHQYTLETPQSLVSPGKTGDIKSITHVDLATNPNKKSNHTRGY